MPARLRDAAHQAFDLSSPGRIKSLEGVRGYAVLLVFLVHYDALFSGLTAPGSMTAALSRLAGGIGHAGVDMFFVISGYLIYGAAFRRDGSIVRFWRRRVRRIYPAFLCVFALYVAAGSLAAGPSRTSAWDAQYLVYLAENLLLLPGIAPITPVIPVAWSLSFEALFYLMLPVLVAVLGLPERSARWRMAFCAGLGLLDLLLPIVGVTRYARLAMFVPGMLLQECAAAGTLDQCLEARGERLTIVIGAMGVLATGWMVADRTAPVAPCEVNYWLPVGRVIILSISLGGLLLYGLRFDGLLRRGLTWEPVCRLGNISYSYYLIHGAALHGFRGLIQPLVRAYLPPALWFWLLLPLGVAVTVAAAVPGFLLVEKRFSLQRSPTPNFGPHQ